MGRGGPTYLARRIMAVAYHDPPRARTFSRAALRDAEHSARHRTVRNEQVRAAPVSSGHACVRVLLRVRTVRSPRGYQRTTRESSGEVAKADGRPTRYTNSQIHPHCLHSTSKWSGKNKAAPRFERKTVSSPSAAPRAREGVSRFPGFRFLFALPFDGLAVLTHPLSRNRDALP